MYQIGLLLLTGPFRLVVESISNYLKFANKNVMHRLYIKLEPEFNTPYPKSEPVQLKRLSDFVPLVYNRASLICKNLDIRIILSNTKKRKIECLSTSQFDVVMTNSNYDENNIVSYVSNYFNDSCKNIVKFVDDQMEKSDIINHEMPSDFTIYKTVCIGGTFDRLHNGHKVLLSEAALRASKKLYVGVTDGPMIHKKTLWELIEPVQKRITDVTNFLLDIDPSLHYEVVPITDPYGPTIIDPEISCVVVSEETKKGGEKVNEERKKRGMNEVSLYVVDVVENSDVIPGEEEKVSSSTSRIHLLGTCLNKPKVISDAEGVCCIFLQGQPLTGKSCISSHFQALGVPVIYCNELITAILNEDDELRNNLCQKFQDELIHIGNSFSLKRLITLCLKDKEKCELVASVVSDKLISKIQDQHNSLKKQGAKYIIIQDSSLLCGKLHLDNINETWSTILPSSEVIKRLCQCYAFTEDDAKTIVSSLPDNNHYIQNSNRIFSNQWTVQITEQQVLRAWSHLKLRQKL